MRGSGELPAHGLGPGSGAGAFETLASHSQPEECTTVYQVKESTRAVMEAAQYVSISKSAINRLTASLKDEDLQGIMAPAAYDVSIHFVDGTWRTVQYLLVLDALNFCFWPGVHAPQSVWPQLLKLAHHVTATACTCTHVCFQWLRTSTSSKRNRALH